MDTCKLILEDTDLSALSVFVDIPGVFFFHYYITFNKIKKNKKCKSPQVLKSSHCARLLRGVVFGLSAR